MAASALRARSACRPFPPASPSPKGHATTETAATTPDHRRGRGDPETPRRAQRPKPLDVRRRASRLRRARSCTCDGSTYRPDRPRARGGAPSLGAMTCATEELPHDATEHACDADPKDSHSGARSRCDTEPTPAPTPIHLSSVCLRFAWVFERNSQTKARLKTHRTPAGLREPKPSRWDTCRRTSAIQYPAACQPASPKLSLPIRDRRPRRKTARLRNVSRRVGQGTLEIYV